MKLVRFMKSSTDRPEEKRARRRSAARGWARRHSRRPLRASSGQGRPSRHGGSANSGFGIVHRELDVFGGQRIGEGRGFVQTATSMMTPWVFQLSLATRGGQHGQFNADAIGDGIGEHGSSVIRIDWRPDHARPG
jgi:hypothetical protein